MRLKYTELVKIKCRNREIFLHRQDLNVFWYGLLSKMPQKSFKIKIIAIVMYFFSKIWYNLFASYKNETAHEARFCLIIRTFSCGQPAHNSTWKFWHKFYKRIFAFSYEHAWCVFSWDKLLGSLQAFMTSWHIWCTHTIMPLYGGFFHKRTL